MKSNLLKALSIEQAKQAQFRLVDCIHKNFENGSFLAQGDLGLVDGSCPKYTKKAEKVLAEFFGAEGCVLLRGAGTGAIRAGLDVMIPAGGSILTHCAAVYPSTEDSLNAKGLRRVVCDFNDAISISNALEAEKVDAALVQHTRQSPDDQYDLKHVIKQIKGYGCPVLVDDNYAILKTEENGISAGADITTFSLFKLQGPPGIGCVLGKEEVVEKIRSRLCTGGMQVQGFEAMEALRGLVTVPVMMAIQAEETERIRDRIIREIQNDEYGILDAFVANMQSRVVIVEFDSPVAPAVIEMACRLGASDHPVGAESKYEITALFYKISRTFCSENKKNPDCFLRINPMRSGCETVFRILKTAIEMSRQERSYVL